MNIHEVARQATARYDAQIGRCSLYLFQNPDNYDLAVGVTCPRKFILAISEPLPNVDEFTLAEWIRTQLHGK